MTLGFRSGPAHCSPTLHATTLFGNVLLRQRSRQASDYRPLGSAVGVGGSQKGGRGAGQVGQVLGGAVHLHAHVAQPHQQLLRAQPAIRELI